MHSAIILHMQTWLISNENSFPELTWLVISLLNCDFNKRTSS